MHGLLEQLAEHVRTPFVLIGGHALQAYGHLRTTLDTAVLVAADSSDALCRELASLGFRKTACNRLVLRFNRPSAPDGYEETLDVLLVDVETFNGILVESRELDLGNGSCRVPSLSHLLALKLHAIRQDRRRELRDLADIESLLRLNPGAISATELRQLASRHAPPDLLPRILQLLD